MEDCFSLLTLVAFSILSTSLRGDIIVTTSSSQFQGSSIDCAAGEDCFVECRTHSGCQGAQINCPDEFGCTVECIADSANSISDVCKQASVSCSSSAHCDISCLDKSSTPISISRACLGAQFYLPTDATKQSLNCGEGSSCTEVTIRAPPVHLGSGQANAPTRTPAKSTDPSTSTSPTPDPTNEDSSETSDADIDSNAWDNAWSSNNNRVAANEADAVTQSEADNELLLILMLLITLLLLLCLCLAIFMWRSTFDEEQDVVNMQQDLADSGVLPESGSIEAAKNMYLPDDVDQDPKEWEQEAPDDDMLQTILALSVAEEEERKKRDAAFVMDQYNHQVALEIADKPAGTKTGDDADDNDVIKVNKPTMEAPAAIVDDYKEDDYKQSIDLDADLPFDKELPDDMSDDLPGDMDDDLPDDDDDDVLGDFDAKTMK